MESEEWESFDRIAVLAKAIMRRNQHRLLVWEMDGDGSVLEDRPQLVLECADGQVEERLWYPALSRYRLTTYPAPSLTGALDTTYEQGCQVGTLLQSWLGDSEVAAHLESMGHRATEDTRSVVIGGTLCRVLMLRAPPQIDLATGARFYDRVDEFFYDSSATLREWRTTVINRRPDNRLGGVPVKIVQRRTYDFNFVDAVSAAYPCDVSNQE